MSESPSKIAKLVSISSSPYQNEMEMKDVKCFAFLCNDVLFDVLLWGSRCRLVQLERFGRRFHLIVENCLEETPFLRLDLMIYPKQVIRELIFTACINGKDIEMSLLNAASFPSFVRFDRASIFLSASLPDEEYEEPCDRQQIAGKCQLLEDQLKLIKPAFDGSIMKIEANIDQNNPYCFNDHYELLNYLSDRFLPICDKSRGYEFWIGSDSDANTTKSIIASILKMEQVVRCSNLTLWLSTADQIKLPLPIEEISNWLHRVCDGGDQREQSLSIQLAKIENLVEVLTHLKETFKDAKSPVQPYIFIITILELKDAAEAKVGEQTLENKITNEELSVRKLDILKIEIKRAAKEKKEQ